MLGKAKKVMAGHGWKGKLLDPAGLIIKDSNVPQLEHAALDEGSKALFNKQIERATETADDVVNRQTEGADEKALGFMKAQASGGPEARAALGLGSMNDDLDKALQTRSQRKYLESSNLSKIKQKMPGGLQAIKTSSKAGDAATTMGATEANRYMAEKLNVAMKKQARAQMFGQVLGTAGMIVGGIYGGPVGAKAGQEAGSGFGQSMGGR